MAETISSPVASGCDAHARGWSVLFIVTILIHYVPLDSTAPPLGGKCKRRQDVRCQFSRVSRGCLHRVDHLFRDSLGG